MLKHIFHWLLWLSRCIGDDCGKHHHNYVIQIIQTLKMSQSDQIRRLNERNDCYWDQNLM